MKTVIVFYSMSGNTGQTAKKLADRLGADLTELKPVKAYPDKGFRKFLRGGRSAVTAETPALQPYSFDPHAYERVIFGFPVWAGNVAPPIRTFVQENREALKGMKLAAFACQSGSGAEKAFGKLRAFIGTETLAPTMALTDPKDRPRAENEQAISEFIAGLG